MAASHLAHIRTQNMLRQGESSSRIHQELRDGACTCEACRTHTQLADIFQPPPDLIEQIQAEIHELRP